MTTSEEPFSLTHYALKLEYALRSTPGWSIVGDVYHSDAPPGAPHEDSDWVTANISPPDHRHLVLILEIPEPAARRATNDDLRDVVIQQVLNRDLGAVAPDGRPLLGLSPMENALRSRLAPEEAAYDETTPQESSGMVFIACTPQQTHSDLEDMLLTARSHGRTPLVSNQFLGRVSVATA